MQHHQNSLSHLIDEVPFSYKLRSGKMVEFTELRFKHEAIQTLPVKKELPILYQNILRKEGNDEISKIDLSKI